MAAAITIISPSGADLSAFLDDLIAAATPTQKDYIWAGNVVKSGILERTQNGVDSDGHAFAPYSTKGPYYYYPGGHPGRSHRKAASIKASVNRILKRTTEVARYREEYLGSTSLGGVKTRSGLGIRFESYADFKHSLGRAGVDLRGATAPHMLQQIEVRMEGDSVVVGIWDDFAAAKAEGHNEGTRTLPRRHFFDAADEDIEAITAGLTEQLNRRVQKLFGS